MFSLGTISFLTPWVLAALALLPVLWWLLRVMPPRPRVQTLPTFFLIRDLESKVKTPAHTPWWLLLLRAVIIALFILALADPVLRLSSTLPGKGGSVLLAVDNGWASAVNWNARTAKMREYLPEIKRSGRSVIFLPLAPSPVDGKIRLSDAMDADAADKWIGQMKPYPWTTEPAIAAEQLDAVAGKISHSIFFSDGTSPSQTQSEEFLSKLGGVTVVKGDEVNDPFVLRMSGQKPGELQFEVERLVTHATDAPMSLVAYAADGTVLDELKFDFPGRTRKADVKWPVLADMRNRIARVSLRQPQMASAVFLTDTRWQQHPVGIAADPSRKTDENFLNEVYYLKRALEGGGSVEVDTAEALTKKPLSAIIWPDSAALTAVERANLLEWVEAGGFLIRFAGPNLAANSEDPLLPVPLRYGQRAMQGAMTWEKPVGLGAISEQSPLYGLDVPKDVTVTRQVLADPVPAVFEKTWLQLEDGTPLITGGSVGKGVVALIHTTAGAEWSDFCYSGLYVETLQRMIALSTGITDYKAEAILPPVMLMDGYGRLQPPDAKGFAGAIDPAAGFSPSPRTPPGIYGDARQFQVFNLGSALAPLQPLTSLPSGAEEQSYELSGEKSLKKDLFSIALLLLLVDTIVTLFLRGVFALPARKAAAAVALVMLMQPSISLAQDEKGPESGIYLGYIETGDAATDNLSYNGLMGLRETVNARTNIRIEGVKAVDPSSEALHFYPVIYWPMTEAQQSIPISAARNIQNYMAEGGLILFDTRDQQFAGSDGNLNGATIGTKKLRQVTQNIQIAEMIPVEKGHILTKSFYLLGEFPGLYAGGKIWVEKEPSANNDSVTSVVIGGNGWAGAWSMDPGDRSRYTVSPGGDLQREIAYRFGVNLMMAALAGNYKADQVHVPYILERIGK